MKMLFKMVIHFLRFRLRNFRKLQSAVIAGSTEWTWQPGHTAAVDSAVGHQLMYQPAL